MQRLIFIFSLFTLLSSCHKKTAEKKIPAYPVRICIAEEKLSPIYIEALGHVQSINSVNIYSRIEGELTGVFFKQGQEVKQNDLLFTIDPKPYEAALKKALGNLEESLADLALAEEKVKRYLTLTKDEFYSQIDYETLQTNMAILKGQVVANQAEVDTAKINLDYCNIYAPIDGMLGILNIDFGNLICVSCQNPIITLNQMAPIFVTFSVPENQLYLIQKALKKNTIKVLAAYKDFSSDVFEGSLYMLDNQVDAGTGMIKLRAIYENTNRELWPGQFVRNRLILEEKNSVVIPFTAVQMTQTKPVVFVVKEDSTVEQRVVKLGQRMDDSVIVLEGIKAGEKIVLEGQLNLFNGTRIYIAKGQTP